MVCDLKIKDVKDSRRKTMPRIKICKLYEDSVIIDFSTYVNKYKDNIQEDISVEGSREVLKELC